MSPDLLIERLHLAFAVALLTVGIVMVWTSPNAIKRIVGLLVANVALLLALASLHAPEAALIATIGAMLVQLLIGAAIVVRLQEGYGSVDVGDFNAADTQSEPAEPRA